jgi:Resolvase, N terminal domain
MHAHHGKYVAYYRVSTDRQGKSGLGLEAQKDAVQARLNGGRWQIVDEFTEVESGKRASRPQLDAAIAACKKHKARLLVAKLRPPIPQRGLPPETDRLRRGCPLCRSPRAQWCHG